MTATDDNGYGRLKEGVETLKARMNAADQSRHDDRRENKEDRHKMAGFITNHEARLEVLEERVPKDLVSRLDKIAGGLAALKWALGAVCGVIMVTVAVLKVIP